MDGIEGTGPSPGRGEPQAGDRIVGRIAAEDRQLTIEACRHQGGQFTAVDNPAALNGSVGLNHCRLASGLGWIASRQSRHLGQNPSAGKKLDTPPRRKEIAAGQLKIAGQHKLLAAETVKHRKLGTLTPIRHDRRVQHRQFAVRRTGGDGRSHDPQVACRRIERKRTQARAIGGDPLDLSRLAAICAPRERQQFSAAGWKDKNAVGRDCAIEQRAAVAGKRAGSRRARHGRIKTEQSVVATGRLHGH
ncbi:MAG: hypothetical protein JNL89_05435 [Rhodanobacteraceae bacterium]|nr:hypothetical protein [Rhodanobacteraceae bacterium]